MTIREALEKKDTRKYLCEKSLKYFSIYYFTKFHFFKMPDFHEEWYKDLLFNDLVGLILVTFRESAKTSLAKIKVIHDICYAKKKFIIWTSYDQQKAEANLYDIALELQTNEKIIADFGNLFFEDQRNKEKFTQKKSIGEFITKNKIKVKAYSTGQSPRGEVYGEYRPDLIILDDIETLKTIESEARTYEVMQYIDELFSGLSGDANVLVLGNRLLEGGSISYIEDKARIDNKWKLHDIPVIKNEEIVWKDKYVLTDKEADEINKNIEDEKLQKVSLETKQRLLGYQAYNREMLNTPITDEEREFKKEWVQYIKPEEMRFKNVRRFLTVDTAISEKDSADDTGIVDNSVDSENFWNIRAYKFRINPKELIDLFFTWHKERNFEAIGVEKTIYLQAIKPFLDEEMRKRNVFLPIVELFHNQTAKETRIRGLIPRYSNRGVRHIVGECEDLEKQLFSFPKGLKDDVVDALAYQQQITEGMQDKIHKTFKPKWNNGY